MINARKRQQLSRYVVDTWCGHGGYHFEEFV